MATREFQLLCRLSHTNILKVFEINSDAWTTNITCEYLTGGTLEELVFQNEISAETSLNYFRQLMGAVAYMHSQGVMHRDIKPSNLLLTGDMATLKLADFNCACEIDPEGSFSPTGTFAWAAPEQRELMGYSEKVDVWASGLVLASMKTGPPRLLEFCSIKDPALRPSAELVLIEIHKLAIFFYFFRARPKIRFARAAPPSSEAPGE